MIINATTTLRDYKKEIEQLKQEILIMENQVLAINEENLSSLKPIMESDYAQLQQHIQVQKDENKHLQKQIIELKMEKSMMQQQIVFYLAKIAALEDQVGF